MEKNSNDTSSNINTSSEQNDNLSSATNVLPTRKDGRKLQRETKHEKDNEGSVDSSKNVGLVPQKVISNIKHVTKNKKTSIICIGIAIIIVILVILVFLVFSKDEKGNSLSKYLDSMRTQDVSLCEIDQINYFFKTYYDALAAGNTTVIEGLFDDPSKASISTEVSKIVESFDNIQVYVTKGINDREIVAFVYNELRFANINTTAPCVDSFYIRYNVLDNSLKIVTNMYTDASIIKFVNVVAKKEPIRSLLSSTNENLNKALDADSALKDLYLIMQSITDNAENISTEQ